MYMDSTEFRSGEDLTFPGLDLAEPSIVFSQFESPDAYAGGSGGAANLYAYVLNDPVNFTDPSGLGEICWNVDATTDDGRGNVTVQSRKVCITLPDYDVVRWGDWSITVPNPPPPPEVCEPSTFTVTGVGPGQAAGSQRTAITQEPGRDINPRGGGIAINPNNFGVPDVSGGRRDVFANIQLYPAWDRASGPSYVPAMPPGLPSTGPYRPIDVIPSGQRHAGNQVDLYRYSSQVQAYQSTRNVPMTAVIPRNEEGVTCPQ